MLFHYNNAPVAATPRPVARLAMARDLQGGPGGFDHANRGGARGFSPRRESPAAKALPRRRR